MKIKMKKLVPFFYMLIVQQKIDIILNHLQ
jgi:hypothetical protein